MNIPTLRKTALGPALFAMAAASATATAATTLSKAEYSAAKGRIAAEYKVDRDACASYGANAKDVCLEQAKGKEKVASAELEYNYTNRPGDAQKLAVAKADLAYAVSKEMCDDKGGNSKDACVSEAKAVRAKALADARMSGKVGDAKKDALDKS